MRSSRDGDGQMHDLYDDDDDVDVVDVDDDDDDDDDGEDGDLADATDGGGERGDESVVEAGSRVSLRRGTPSSVKTTSRSSTLTRRGMARASMYVCVCVCVFFGW